VQVRDRVPVETGKRSSNIYESNFIDSEALDDIEALQDLAFS